MKAKSSFLALVFVLCAALPVGAATFTPSDMDLFDLDHYRWYTWKVDYSPSADEVITGASLNIYDIYNWAPEANDRLSIWLLDDPINGNVAPDIYRGTDNQANTDYIAGYAGAGDKAWVANYTDLDDNKSSEALTYDLFALGLGDELNAFASDFYFGFGFDPDCHYYNSRIELDITTARVPEPSSLLLLGTGLIGLAGLRRRFAR